MTRDFCGRMIGRILTGSEGSDVTIGLYPRALQETPQPCRARCPEAPHLLQLSLRQARIQSHIMPMALCIAGR